MFELSRRKNPQEYSLKAGTGDRVFGVWTQSTKRPDYIDITCGAAWRATRSPIE